MKSKLTKSLLAVAIAAGLMAGASAASAYSGYYYSGARVGAYYGGPMYYKGSYGHHRYYYRHHHRYYYGSRCYAPRCGYMVRHYAPRCYAHPVKCYRGCGNWGSYSMAWGHGYFRGF